MAHRKGRDVARLPDRGELIAYERGIPATRSRAYAWHPVEISEAHAINAIGGKLALRGPDGRAISLKYERHIEHPDGNWTWIGRADGGAPGTEAIITFGDKAIFGSIPYGDRQPLRLTTAGNHVWMMETDGKAVATLPAAQPKGTDAPLPPLRGLAEAPLPVSMSGATAEAVGQVGGGTTVDVLLGYTTAFASRLGGVSQANTRLNYLVDVTNQAYVNSQIDAQVRLVGTLQVAYPDNTSNKTALEELTGVVCETSCSEAPVPAALQPLHVARDQYGADLVSLVRNFNYPENGGCGIAWLIGGGQVPIDQTDEYAGMSVVSDSNGTVTPPAFPDDGYVCRDETLAHEFGHNMGSAHDRDTSDGEDNILQADEYGRYPYSFGYKTTAGAGNFYTIMAYGDSGQNRNRIFSTPLVSTCGPASSPIYACGVADQADNARSLRQTIPIIATFRNAASTSGPALIDDMNGDGKSDIFWRHPDLGALGNWLMNGAVRLQALTATPRLSATSTVVARGDFNADGRMDVLWNSPSRVLRIWFSSGSNYSESTVGSYASGWAPVGVGDFSGDGRADILLRQATTGAFAYWRMSGAIVQQSVSLANTLSSAYVAVAVRDFDGNGFADVLWTSPAGDLRLWWANGSGGFGDTQIGTYAAGWNPLGAGDIDGNGKADILLRQSPGGAIRYLLMDGAVISQTVDTGLSAPLAYQVAAIADYNGDAKADVLWTSSARDLWLWTGTGSSFNAGFVASYPNNWVPAPAGG